MTTLNDRLREILPEVLPTTPEKAILGSDLLNKVKPKLNDEYSDNAIRQTFPALSQDPTSPIARKEQGYGYYRRDETPILEAEYIAEFNTRDNQPEEKFRAFFIRYIELGGQFPIHIDHVKAQRGNSGANKWKFPDVVMLDWKPVQSAENPLLLDGSLLEVKRGLGEQLFSLSSVELKVEISLPTFREYFFQCVSNSKWAHSASLVIAKPISDNLLANELKRLGASYGIAVNSFNFTDEKFNKLPAANKIKSLSNDDFEKLTKDVSPQDLSSAPAKLALDWEHVADMKKQSQEFERLFDWIARCLKDKRAYTLEEYTQLVKITAPTVE